MTRQVSLPLVTRTDSGLGREFFPATGRSSNPQPEESSRLVSRGSRSRRTAENDQIAYEQLHRLVMLIERRGPHLDRALIRPRLRRSYFEHFAFHMQLVSGPDRPRPAELVESSADDAARGLDIAFDQKTHGHRCRMPAARSQSLEE